ncbi:hypothetical protein GQ607_017108 [Colletotrichum asianum]|uniref:Uncharacterized protein n=1 Tax=Colletotrichum asianum TaxID=702518 RepID=A0A8H3ZDM3_9PEZI|nr:hypothetical protein GQ607_017108 [Colletotrichum asianum]
MSNNANRPAEGQGRETDDDNDDVRIISWRRLPSGSTNQAANARQDGEEDEVEFLSSRAIRPSPGPSSLHTLSHSGRSRAMAGGGCLCSSSVEKKYLFTECSHVSKTSFSPRTNALLTVS